jgi:drug/metabolite transporter (DMT)-like permease
MHVKPHWPSSAIKGGAIASSGLLYALLISALVLLNQVFNIGATIGFARSGLADRLAAFIGWQIFGSIFGLGSQITFAGLVRFFSLKFANAIGIGLAFVSVQIFSAYITFHEPFSSAQWFGTALVFLGILFIALGHGG